MVVNLQAEMRKEVASCNPPFRVLFWYADAYKGKEVSYRRREVIQVEKGSVLPDFSRDEMVARISMTKEWYEDGYSWGPDQILLHYNNSLLSHRGVKEPLTLGVDDTISFRGVALGNVTYTALLGNDFTVPHIKATEIDIRSMGQWAREKPV